MQYRYIGGELHTQIVSSEKGVIQCRLRRAIDLTDKVIEADLWQSTPYNNSEYTSFRSVAYLAYTGVAYEIVDPVKYHGLNTFWVEVERLLSAVIMLNE